MAGTDPVTPGSALYLRSVFDDHVGAVMPCVTVVDTADHVAVYQPAGTTMLIRSGRRGGPTGRNMFPDGWDGGHDLVPWVGGGVLRVHRRGEPWSVWRWWDPTGWRAGCYVNLERPWQRGPLGYDTTDWILDLVVDADGAVSWKDQDELDWCALVGAVSSEQAARVQAAGHRAAAAIDAGAWPFDAQWDHWRPVSSCRAPAVESLTGARRAAVLRVTNSGYGAGGPGSSQGPYLHGPDRVGDDS